MAFDFRRHSLHSLAMVGLAAACTTADHQASEDVARLSVHKSGTAGGCRIVMRQTYPEDLSPQARRVVVRDRDNDGVRSEGALPLPRPADDPRVIDNGDGTRTFDRFFQWGYSPCRDVALIVEVGPCESGQCLPLRVDTASLPDGVSVSVRR